MERVRDKRGREDLREGVKEGEGRERGNVFDN